MSWVHYSAFSFKSFNYIVLKINLKNNISLTLGINRFFVNEYVNASNLYPMKKISKIISLIKDVDLKSKGLASNSNTHSNLLNQLIVQIMS